MAITYTVAECEARIAAFEAKLDEIAVLPTVGSTPATSLDHSKTADRINERLAVWRDRLAVARAGGVGGQRTRRFA